MQIIDRTFQLAEMLQAWMDGSTKVLYAECRRNMSAIYWPSNQASWGTKFYLFNIVREINTQLCCQVNILLNTLEQESSLQLALEFYIGFITLIERQ